MDTQELKSTHHNLHEDPEPFLSRHKRPVLLISLAAVLVVITLTIYHRSRVNTADSLVSDNRPNIILILTDDQRADTVQYMPQVQKLLAARGMSFTQAYSSTPLCCPARASLLTGLYAHNTGVWGNKSPLGGYPVFKDSDTLAVWLQKAGYRTGLIGKYLNEYKTTDVPPGWDTWYGRTKNTYYGYTLNQNGTLVTYGFKPKDYSTDVYGTYAVDFINGTAGEVGETNVPEGKPNGKKDRSQKKDRQKKNKQSKRNPVAVLFSIPAAEAAEGRKPFFLMVAVDAPHTDGGKSAPEAQAAKRAAKARNDSDAPGIRLKQQRDQTENEDDDDDISTDSPDGQKTHVVKDYYAMPAEKDRENCKTVTVSTNPAFAEADISDKPVYLQKIPVWNQQDIDRMTRFASSQVCAVQAVDRMVKKIVTALGPERENTVIIFASDNGFSWGEHRWSLKNCTSDACTHIPLIISYPQITKTRQQTSSFAELVDIPVTIAAIAGAVMPEHLNGLSLIPILRDSQATVRDSVFLEIYNGKNRPKGEDYAVRTQDYKYVELSTGERELYDLTNDPSELQNLFASKTSSAAAQSVVSNLSAQLAAQKAN